MKNARLTISTAAAGVALAALLLAPTSGVAQDFTDLESYEPLLLRGQGSFYLNGDTKIINGAEQGGGYPWFGTTRLGGLVMNNQMYVEYMWPLKQPSKKPYPIVFVHGGILSSKKWETTPDGRMGWDEYFVRKGFDTYLAEQVSRGRSGFDASKYNLVRAGDLPPSEQPPILIGGDQSAWNGFRFGTTRCTVSPCAQTTQHHPDIRFPMHTVGVGAKSNLNLYAQNVPDMNATLSAVLPPSGFLDPPDADAFYNTPAQMARLAKKLNGAILVGHSESSTFPARAALQPEAGCYPYTTASACKVKGIIQIEVGCFENLTEPQVNTLSKIPTIVVIGDYFANPNAFCQRQIQQITDAGGDIQLAILPQLTRGSLYRGSPGPIFGNTHMLMQDDNNLEIAQMLIDWAKSRGLHQSGRNDDRDNRDRKRDRDRDRRDRDRD